LWESSNAVAIVPRDRPADLAAAAARVLSSSDERARISAAGRELYDARFALQHTIRALRGRAPSTDRQTALRHAS
jgi:glycosyltransferase involved in cell wall biosynthesis